MQPSKRIIVNTAAQYTRSIFNMVLGLISTRVILKTLGVDDFGIYSVVAGAVSLLSFITNALVVTTQRYLSVTQGEKNAEKSKTVFNNCLVLHLFIGLLIVTIMEILYPFLMNGFLNIPEVRLSSAKALYHTIVCVMWLTLVTSPFRAVIVSHENIVYISIIEVLDATFKLLIAFALYFINADKLFIYGVLLVGIQLFNLLALSIYAYSKFPECIMPRKDLVDTKYMKEIFSFAGWTMYNIGCNFGRTQGIAIALNKAYTTAINAAYGLGFQVSGGLSALSQSLANAINPQLMKAEGAGNRNKMLRLAEVESKFSFLFMAALSIPALFEIETLLQLWLGRVPEHSALFCRMVIMAALCDMLTFGLGSANKAIGDIRNYTLLIYTIKLSTLFVVILLLFARCPLYSIAIAYVVIEFISSIIRINFLKHTAGLNVRRFVRNVIFKEIIPICILVLACYCSIWFISWKYRFIITFIGPIILFLASIYFWGLCPDEKQVISNYLLKLRVQKK